MFQIDSDIIQSLFFVAIIEHLNIHNFRTIGKYWKISIPVSDLQKPQFSGN